MNRPNAPDALTRAAAALTLALALAACPDPAIFYPNANDAPGDTGGGWDPTKDLPEVYDPDAAHPDSDITVAICSEDDDCAHLDDCCYTGWCYNGTCQLKWKVDCCTELGPCATVVSAYDAECVAQCVPGGCEKSLDLSDDACGDTVWSYRPGDGQELEISDDAPDDTVTWHLTSRRGLAGGLSLYAGDVTCPTYHTGPLDAACKPVSSAPALPISMNAILPAFDVPPDQPAVARVWLWMDLEGPPNPASPDSAFDRLDIGVAAEGSLWASPRWSSREAEWTPGQWTPVLIDVTEYAGQRVGLHLMFETGDGIDNDHEGVYVGGVDVFVPCAADRTCPADAPCAVGTSVPVTPLTDALCVVAPADPGAVCEVCTTDADCATTDPCDVGACDAGVCTITHELTPQCCTPDDVWPPPASFEDDWGEGFELEPTLPEGAAGWHRSDMRARTGDWSLRFGRVGEPGLADPDMAAEQTFWAPEVVVPTEAAILTLQLWMSTEWDAAPSPSNPLGLDRLEILAARTDLPGQPPAVVWTSDAVGGTTSGAWEAIEADLSALGGIPVRVGLRFSTGDETANDGEGVYVDDLALVRKCPVCPPGDETCDGTVSAP